MIPFSTFAFLLSTLFITPENNSEEARPAPEFPQVAAERWLNSPPLTMAGLRGKVIMLDVWTFM